MFFYISQQKTLKLWNYGILTFSFLAHLFINRFWQKFLWMLTLRRSKFFIIWRMTSKVIKGNIWLMKCHFYVMEKFCDLFILRPSDLITTLTYVLMDNFCPCFYKELISVIIVGILHKIESIEKNLVFGLLNTMLVYLLQTFRYMIYS